MGETAQLVAQAVLSQLPDGSARLRRFNHIETPVAAREVLAAAEGQPTLIIFTVIVPEVREVILEGSDRLGITAVDIMGPALSGVERISGHKALLEPGLIHRLDEKYFRRVEAIEFAVQHDDGKDPRGYRKADVVLLGVSRTSKTPVSMYLANRGVKAANLPLIPGIVLPSELSRVPVKRIIGLTINPGKLGQIRKERERAMGLRGATEYSDPKRIREELGYAGQLFEDLGCDVIDVTDRAVEETAAEVMEMVRIFRSSTA
jgi:regulator of PEP synthase PpsR (kinase-PPPase family)